MVRPRVSHAKVCKAFALAICFQSQQALSIHRSDLPHSPKQWVENRAGTSEGRFPHQETIRTQVFNDGKTSLVESSLPFANKHLAHERSVARQTKFARHTLKAAVVMDSSGEIERHTESTTNQWDSNDMMPEQVPTTEITIAPSLTESRLASSVRRHAPTAVILGSSGEATMVTPSSENPSFELDKLMASGAKIASYVTPSAAIGAMPAAAGAGGSSATTALSATGAQAMLAAPAVPAAPVAPVATAAAPASAAVPAVAAVPVVAAVPAVPAVPAAAAVPATPAAPVAPAAPATPAIPAAPAAAVASVAPVASAAGAPPGAPASASVVKSQQGRSLLPTTLGLLLVFLVFLALIALIEIKRRRQLLQHERSSRQSASGQLGVPMRQNSYRPRRESTEGESQPQQSFKKSSYRARMSAAVDSHQNVSSGADGKDSPRSVLDRSSGVPGQSVPLGTWEKPSRKSGSYKTGRTNSSMAPVATSSTRLSNDGSASASPSLHRDRIKKGENSMTLHRDLKTAGLNSEHLQNMYASSEQGSAPEMSPEGSRPKKLTTTVERDEEGDYLI